MNKVHFGQSILRPSSSWAWGPHITGSVFFGPLLRAGVVVLDQFFAKCKFCICEEHVGEKNYHVQKVLGPKKDCYFQGRSIF